MKPQSNPTSTHLPLQPRVKSTTEAARDAALRLAAYCRERDWAGYDPYDALNSEVFKALPFLDFRLARLALTQFNKRSPVNFRSILRVAPTQNPKGLALFARALVKLTKAGIECGGDELMYLAERISALRSPQAARWCWGYSFPWQTRTVLVPRGTPNLVCTTFVANALLDLFEYHKQERHLLMGISAAEYILEELYYTEGTEIASFHYPFPGNRAKVHNANLLAAALLARVSRYSGESKFLEPGLSAARYSVRKQQADGSWFYGELPTQRWIDNFHTGFNLCALSDIETYAETGEFKEPLELGLRFYREHFFEADGAPKYFHDRIYPLDVHSAAQSIITLRQLAELHPENPMLAERVCQWSLDNLRDEQGYFYSQKNKRFTNQIPYMRWGQAWMLLALAWFTPKRPEVERLPGHMVAVSG
jgi:hypothetical protein